MAKSKLLNSAATETSERHISSLSVLFDGNDLSAATEVPAKKLPHRSKYVVRRFLWQSGFVLSLSTMFGCATQPIQPVNGKPGWMESLIANIEKEPVWNPPATITRYNYRGAVVYYLAPHCCDIRSKLYDVSGNVLCEPDGGITGKGDGKCDDFIAARTDEKLIWQDQRGK